MAKENKIFDYKQYYGLFIENKFHFLIPFFAVLTIAILAVVFLPKRYTASTTVLIEQANVIKPLMKDIAYTSDMSERLNTIRQQIESRPFLERVLKQYYPDDKLTAIQLEEKINALGKQVELKQKGRDMFQIIFKSSEPAHARDMANNLTTLLITENISAKQAESTDSVEFIQKQLGIYKEKLEESEKALRTFKEENIGQLPGAEQTTLSNLERFTTDLTNTSLHIKELERKKENLVAQLSKEEPMIVGFTSTDSTSLTGRLSALQTELARLMTEYTDKYPDVIRVKREIEELKKQLNRQSQQKVADGSQTMTINPMYQRLKEDLSRTDQEIASFKERERDLKGKIAIQRSKAHSVPRMEQELTRLTRDYTVNNTLYQTLLRRLEDAKISSSVEEKTKPTTFKIIDPAILPVQPSGPTPLKMILLGLFTGTIAGIFIVLTLDYLKNPIKSSEHIKSEYGITVLARIPRITTQQDIESARKQNISIILLGVFYTIVILGLLIKENYYYLFG